MSEKKSNSKNQKKRNWAFLLYPDSAPENWRDILQSTGLPCVIGPLHDQDINPTGEPKKPHYHIILAYPGPTTFNVVKQFTDRLKQPIPQPLDSVKGYYRYLTHKDNPEKAQYSTEDIKPMNGFNILDYSDLTRSEVTLFKRQIHTLILEKDFCEYMDLMTYLLDNQMWEEYDVASNNTIFFDKLLTSKRHKSSDSVILVDSSTGEVLEKIDE